MCIGARRPRSNLTQCQHAWRVVCAHGRVLVQSQWCVGVSVHACYAVWTRRAAALWLCRAARTVVACVRYASASGAGAQATLVSGKDCRGKAVTQMYCFHFEDYAVVCFVPRS
uniref:Unkown protein n=1 Tax=Riptortus pedestris TaxID=329032 RepID=R4WIK6_RIPPE|nr:unkown protein [Riptortus pedestris]